MAEPQAVDGALAAAAGDGAVAGLPPRAAELGAKVVAWAQSHGAQVSGKVAFLQPGEHGDRCCVALADLGDEEVLLSLPRHLVFETPPAQPAGVPDDLVALLQSVAEHDEADRPAGRSLAVALLLHHERLKGDASEFAPYIDALPGSFPTMPLFDGSPPWDRSGSAADGDGDGGTAAAETDEPELYQGTGVEGLVDAGMGLTGKAGVAMMREAIERLDPEGMFWHHMQRSDNDSVLRWAAAAVQSRAHASRHGATALVPLADAFNHSATVPNVELVEAAAAFHVRTARPVREGEELLLSYGPFSNAELLFNAGFTCERNPHDCLLLTRQDLLAAAEAQWLACDHPIPVDLRDRCEDLTRGLPVPRLSAGAPLLGGAVPADVVTVLAGLLLALEDWRRALATPGDETSGVHGRTLRAAVREHWVAGGAAADALRRDVMEALQALIDSRLLPRYAGSSIEEDRRWLQAAAAAAAAPDTSGGGRSLRWLRRLNILRVRVGERTVLASLRTSLQSRLAGGGSAGSGAPPAKRPKLEQPGAR